MNRKFLNVSERKAGERSIRDGNTQMDGGTNISSAVDDDDNKVRREIEALVLEQKWLKIYNTEHAFLKLQKILVDCCRHLHVSNKLYPFLDPGSKPASSEQLQLKQRNGMDNLKATIVLVGENIIQSEVSLKYPKAPGGVLKTCAQPEVQWKLQQLQDARNFCCMAMNTINKGLELVKEQSRDGNGKVRKLNDQMGNQLSMVVGVVSDCILRACSTICLPRKRTLLELCNFPPTKCFKPPLPPDLVFSYYVASTKVICAAYQVTSKQNDVTKTLASCELPLLVKFLSLLEQAIEVVRELRCNFSAFDAHINSSLSLKTGSS
uniref:DHC_N1 domain-containing protein n=1 Tax=Syphacia muris TaxID=451379 RepID=A0A0N5A9U0_9BILA